MGPATLAYYYSFQEVSRLGHSRSAILDALRLETTAEGDGAPMKFEEFSRAIQRLKLDVEVRVCVCVCVCVYV